MRNLCIIPARGGSKRIPKKNIKDFLGKPIIVYSIETALKSGLFDEVMVSTDDEEIANISKKYGANIPFLRSRKNANDFAILNDVFEEVITEYKNKGKNFDNYCIILPTSPLIKPEDLKKSLNLMKEKKFDSVRPVVQFSYPIQRAFKMDKNGKVEMFNPQYFKTRSQDLEPAFHDAGQFYWINTNKTMLDTNKGAFKISEIQAQDIDNETDWQLAELKYKLLFNID